MEMEWVKSKILELYEVWSYEMLQIVLIMGLGLG